MAAGLMGDADGPAIMGYLRETVDEYGLLGRIRFGRRLHSASWCSEQGIWMVRGVHSVTGEPVQARDSVLFMCAGYYSYNGGYLPEFEGRERFAGRFVHPQEWPEDLNYAGKRVAVIGSGATAMTLVPAMAADVGHITMIQRSPTYVASRPAVDKTANRLRRFLPEWMDDDLPPHHPEAGSGRLQLTRMMQSEQEIEIEERMTRIELAFSAWEADVLPLNYTRRAV